MTKYVSQKLSGISFFAILMVVMLHCYNLDIKQNGVIVEYEQGYNWFIQTFISYGITRIAVPLFFLISGYLFFLSFNGNGDFILKIKKRLKTLVIPYFFWVFFGIFLYHVMQTLPQSQQFFTKKLIKSYNSLDWIDAIFIHPIPYQLWFLKDLIILTLLSPLLYIFIKKLRLIFLIIILPFWILNQDTVLFSSESVLFFSTGILLKQFHPELISKQITERKGWFFLIIWILILLIKTFSNLESMTAFYPVILLKASIIIGVISFWYLYDIFYPKIENSIYKWNALFGTSFFIYVFHEPFLTIVKKGLFYMLGKEKEMYLIIYFLSYVIVILICILTGFFLKKVVPNFYKLITGNR